MKSANFQYTWWTVQPYLLIDTFAVFSVYWFIDTDSMHHVQTVWMHLLIWACDCQVSYAVSYYKYYILLQNMHISSYYLNPHVSKYLLPLKWFIFQESHPCQNYGCLPWQYVGFSERKKLLSANSSLLE